MNSIAERIKYIRKQKHLSQAAFAETIGMTRDMISNYEQGRADMKEPGMKLLCQIHGISYDWLKNGTGDMIDKTDDELIGLVDRILGDDIPDTAKSVFRAFAKLDNDDWELLGKIIDDIAAERAKK